MRCRVGIERTVGKSLPYLFPLLHQPASGETENGFREAFPDIINRQRGGMKHIISIKPVITQFVHHYLIGREIMARGKLTAKMRHSQQQSGLAQLIAVHAVPYMADRADGEQDIQPGISGMKFRQQGNIDGFYLTDLQQAA